MPGGRTLAVLLALLPFAAGVADGMEQPPPRDVGEFPWVDQPMFRADAARSGVVPGARVPDRVEEAWRIRDFNPGFHTAAKGSAAAVGGILYVGSDDGTLSAIRAADGEVLWRAATGESANGIHGTPAVHGDLVIVGAYDGHLHAFDRATGATRWATRVGDYVGASPVVWQDRVYIAAETDRPSGILVVLDLEGNVLARDGRMRSHPHSSPAIDAATSTIAVGDNTGNLTVWDLTPDGMAHRFTFNVRPDPATNDIKGPIATHDGSAYFGSWDRHVYRVDLRTGEKVWSHRVPGYVMSGAAIWNGTVYIGSHDSHLYALDADDGSLRWKHRAGGRTYGSPTIADGRLLFGSHDGFLHCLDAETGRHLWAHDVGGYVTSSPVLAGDGVVVAARRVPGHTGDLVMVRAE